MFWQIVISIAVVEVLLCVQPVELSGTVILITSFFDRDHFCGKRGHLERHFILLVRWVQITFFAPRIASFAAFATRNLTVV
jgi:hypothetical protein